MRPLLVLALTFCLAGPVTADEDDYTIYPLGDRWYLATLHGTLTLPTSSGQWAARVTIGLDDIPGGLDSGCEPQVYTIGHAGDDLLTVSKVGFHPLAYSRYVADCTLLIRNDSGVAQTYKVKVKVRGKE